MDTLGGKAGMRYKKIRLNGKMEDVLMGMGMLSAPN